MKKLLHRILLSIGIMTWGVSVITMALTAYIAILGHWLLPEEEKSNCWIYALPKYGTKGGYLLVRHADDVRLFKKIRIPHVIYLENVPDNLVVEQWVPVERSKNKWMPWKTLFYKGRVKTEETPHGTDG